MTKDLLRSTLRFLISLADSHWYQITCLIIFYSSWRLANRQPLPPGFINTSINKWLTLAHFDFRLYIDAFTARPFSPCISNLLINPFYNRHDFNLYFLEHHMADIASCKLLSPPQLSTQRCKTRKYSHYKGKTRSILNQFLKTT